MCQAWNIIERFEGTHVSVVCERGEPTGVSDQIHCLSKEIHKNFLHSSQKRDSFLKRSSVPAWAGPWRNESANGEGQNSQ